MDRRQVRVLLIVGIIIGAALGPTVVTAIASFLSNSVAIQGGVVVHAPSGPAVTVNESADINLTAPFPDANTVDVSSSAGNATFISSGRTNVTVEQLNGTWTNVTGLDVATTGLYINPDDKPAVNVSGDVATLDFHENMQLDDGAPDFVYSGASGTTTVTVRGVAANEQVKAVDAVTGAVLASGTSNGNGVVTLSGMPNSEHTVELWTDTGGPGLSDPAPEGQQADFPTTMNVTVSDPDFDVGENVTVEFYMDGSKVGETSTTAAGDVGIGIAQPARGDHTAKAVATDANGNTQTLTWEFSVANELFVRTATDPWPLINDREVEFTFYEDDQIFTRNTTDGSVNLTGLPIDGDIVATVNASGYNTGTVIIEDITQQQTVYLTNATATSTVEVRFTLNDRTGNFEGNNAELFIQKPINRTGTVQWETVHADEFGVVGVVADLEDGQRYRLLVKNDDNDVRVLGTYTADVSETVELTVGSVQAVPDGSEVPFTYNASYVNSTSGSDYVSFEYNDTDNATSSITIRVFERGNESENTIYPNQTFNGPLGSFAISVTIPAGQEGKTWVIEAVGTRNGEDVHIREIVGPRRPLLGDMPNWLKAIISIGTIWMVGGLFSQLNASVGAVAMSGLGGMFWYVDFLPTETGIGVVVLAMITSGVLFVHSRRGGGGL